MIEIELKLLLPDAAAARALASAAARSPLAEGAVQRRKLRSVYFDTPDRRLAQAGIALRLRRKSRAWLQTVKRRAAGRIGAGRGAGGLFSVEEDERPAPGGRLDLALVAPDLRDAVEAALGDAPLTAIFETEIQRAALILTPPSGRVELAVDAGRVVAGEAEAPLFEAEFELLSGDPAAVYEAARTLQGQGAWRFSERSKAERGHALAEGRPALPDAAARRARAIAFDPAGPTEAAAAAALLECLAQIDANMAACLAAD
ncbi:MAG: CYTH domain-containing protein, partial [Pseudomonadota bacterium]